ncbi:NAD-dependent epimerase/dehydratase family protein [Sphingobium estronivorans]|uniref:NAD-dependent epimerase/dehydratase family protein n=1 Tax=Sphingobium estronivorans TaxID=1577690 RepID=UPI001239BEB5|nr:NAD(P)-dependent oxidoreductase [Sphingobium estronivorans]
MRPLLALTGGSGFVGRHFAAAARQRGYRIRHLSRQCPGEQGDEWRHLDLAAADTGTPDLKGCTVLIHLAAHIPANHQDPAEAVRCWQVNALGTLHLVEAAIRDGVGRIMQASSANAYAPTVDPPDEAAPLFPRSRGYYLGSKIAQEIYATERCRAAGVMLQTLRLGSVYGEGQQSGALGAMMRAASGGTISVHGKGGFGSDLVSIADVVQAMLLLLGSEESGPFNIGSGMRTTIAELADLLARQTGAAVVHESATEEDWGFPPLNIDRLRGLGYCPAPLVDGLRGMLAGLEFSPAPYTNPLRC